MNPTSPLRQPGPRIEIPLLARRAGKSGRQKSDEFCDNLTHSTYTNSLLLKTTRQRAERPCFSANSTSGACSASIKCRP